MDLIYGKRSSENGQEDVPKRPKLNSTGNLPIHLPSLPTQIFGGSTRDKNADEPVGESDEGNTAGKQKPALPVPGTDIVLESKADIDDWIKKRKENWMKKISNKREETKVIDKKKEETNGEAGVPKSTQDAINKAQPKYAQKRDIRQNNATDPHLQNRQLASKGKPQSHRFNLNNAIIQRELSRENTKILDVIKELFDRGVVPKP